MATARRAWFRAPDDLGQSNLTDKLLASTWRLHALMNTRWARGGLSAEEAAELTLSRGQILHVTRCGQIGKAMGILQELSEILEFRVEMLGDSAQISYAKYAEFQAYRTRELPESAPAPAPAQAQALLTLSEADTDPPNSGPAPTGERPTDPPISHQLVTRTWERAKAALERYGHPSAEQLDTKRRARIRAILRDSTVPPEELVTVLARAVHGYVARCGLQGRDGYDPLQGFKLGKLMSPERFALNFDAAQDALARGKSPPFQKGDNVGRPRRVRAAGPVLVGELGDLVAGMGEKKL